MKGVSVAKKQPSRLDRLENKFDLLENKFDRLETKLDKFIDVQMKFNERQDKFNKNQDKFHNMLVQIPSIQQGLKTVKAKGLKTEEELGCLNNSKQLEN